MTPSKACIARLQKEYKTLLKAPPPGIRAHPNPSNMLEWHYVLEGQQGSDYEGGIYHGKLMFPPQYPFGAPGITMTTPNGRFAINTKLCLSMSDFHPETWNPLWSIGTILTGLMSFMYDNEVSIGSISTSRTEKRRFAAQSLEQNLKLPMFRRLFPEYIELHQQRQKEQRLRREHLIQQRNSQSTRGQMEAAVESRRSLSSILLIASLVAVAGSLILIPLTS